MRIPLLTVAFVGLSFALSAPTAFAAKKTTASEHQKCANLDGDTVTVTGTALGATFNRGRDETYFMVVKSDLPCEAIDVTVKGPLDCGADKRVRVEGKLHYDDKKIVNAYLENATALCAPPPGQPPAAAAAPAAPAPAAAEPAKAPVLAEPKAATETPSFYKLP